MPFQSEKQRRYLWANEPKIARDWTDTYGSKIHKASGGRIGFARGSDPRALKQRFIEIIQLMSRTSGEKLTALVVEAQHIKQQLKDLARIEPSTGQGIQGISRGLRMEGPEILEASIKKQVDPDFKIYPEGYERKQIFPGRRPDRIIEEQIVGITPERIVRPVSGSMRGMSQENRERLKRLRKKRPQRAQGGRIQYGFGGDVVQQVIKNIIMKQARKKGEELGYFPDSTQKKGIGSFIGRILATMFLGPMGGLAFDAGSGFMRKRGSSFAPRAGSFTNPFSRGSPQDRQNRINMQRQSNIIKTLESGKYAPGWEKTAFENVQKLGKNLNLVDAADVGLTRKPKPKAPAPVRHHTNGGGDKNQPSGRSDAGHAAAGGSGMHGGRHYDRGGLADLWQR